VRTRAWWTLAIGLAWGCEEPGAWAPRKEGETRCNGESLQRWSSGFWSTVQSCSYQCAPSGCPIIEGRCFIDPTSCEPEATRERYAVIIDDSVAFANARGLGGSAPCTIAPGPLFAHGADIDAVGLFRGDALLGYFDVVDYREGGVCTGLRANTMTDERTAIGAPDARVDGGFVSLGGGYLTGEFDNQIRVLEGDVLVIYEAGKLCVPDGRCEGLSEDYEVFVAEDLDCVNVGNGYPYATCAVAVGGVSRGETRIEVPAF